MITLAPTEVMQGALVGVMRQLQNLRDARSAAHGAGTSSDWQLHVEGALAEMALAKHLGRFYAGVGTFRGADVGDCDVRATTHDRGCLLLHPEDPDERTFWLLTGANGTYQVRGWILGRDGKREEWWRDPKGGRPCYFVPQEALRAP